jgi:hypothetical protein
MGFIVDWQRKIGSASASENKDFPIASISKQIINCSIT